MYFEITRGVTALRDQSSIIITIKKRHLIFSASHQVMPLPYFRYGK
jgi:hypothetical protein